MSDEQRARRDRRRGQELLRYYQSGSENDPIQQCYDNQKTSRNHSPLSPDTTLTALAQLIALRLNCSRSMISVIGRDTQYILAESTRTLSLVDNSVAEVDGDNLWLGCGTVDKKGGLCEATVNLSMDTKESSVFVVPDLSKHEAFKDRPYVAGPPHWRFYAGAPLRTKNGVNIGSLCVLDDCAREGLSEDKEAFLSVIANTAMHHLEMKQEAQQRQKVTRMSRGLKAFVEGKFFMSPEIMPPHAVEPDLEVQGASKRTKSPGYSVSRSPGRERKTLPIERKEAKPPNGIDQHPLSNEEDARTESISSLPQHMQHRKPGGSMGASEELESSADESDNNITGRDADHGIEATFSRAANLLREALDLHDGAVTFCDTVSGILRYEENHSQVEPSKSADEGATGEPGIGMSEGSTTEGYRFRSVSSAYDSELQLEGDLKTAEVLGASFAGAAMDTNFETKKHLPSVSEKVLQGLLKRHPQGKLWSFDDDGTSLSAEDEPVLATNYKSLTRKQMEAKLLRSTFPGVRQLLFMPLWDAGQARWFAGCFCSRTNMHRTLWTEAELSFLTAFSNSVMAEVSRLATVAADQQKGDFIGSISHELRSPLHGILASAEFMSESECNAYQMSLIDTIDSCGRTLLDTINHVLDFSKINSFERSWRKAGRRGIDSRSSSISSAGKGAKINLTGAPPLLNIYAVTDVAAVCEEVIEGVWAGQVFSSTNSAELTDVNVGNRGRTSDKGTLTTSAAPGIADLASKKPVDIILDIAKGNYTFTTQPGAVRRVIMNVIGNALKYTDQGLIEVVVGLQDLPDVGEQKMSTPEQALSISIKDTGKGISNHYLRTRLFTPFAQENSLAPGTGLGLSIVRGIVNMLGGSIHIESQVGVGTKVQITIPMDRPHRRNSQATPKSSTDSLDREIEDSVSALKVRFGDQRVGLFGFESTSSGDTAAAAGRVIRHYLTSWYGVHPVTEWTPSESPQVVIVDERDSFRVQKGQLLGSSLLILCSSSSTYSKALFAQTKCSCVEILLKPFGPYKLAKALKMCFEKALHLGSEPAPGEAVPPKFPTENALQNGHATTEREMPSASALNIPSGSKDSLQLDSSRPPKNSPEANTTENGDQPQSSTSSAAKVLAVADSLPGRELVSSPPPASRVLGAQQRRIPHVLLVDDNAVNLRLLRMFMLKRKYSNLGSAENGQLALEAFQKSPSGYDVIFMDISMPVMNGFEATRAIRQLERARRAEPSLTEGLDGSDEQPQSSVIAKTQKALIVALTGLASGRDQDEAFTSGVDLFMTKPVSFKEVGRLLDHWERAREDEEDH